MKHMELHHDIACSVGDIQELLESFPVSPTPYNTLWDEIYDTLYDAMIILSDAKEALIEGETE